jgi:phage baseplate assembly protein W
MNVAFPFRFDARGRTAHSAPDEHIRGLIEQVLFTAPGERVNRPGFGSGLAQLVFEPNSETRAAAAQVLVRAALQQWLGDLIEVEDVAVESEDQVLRVAVQYVTLRSLQREVARFSTGARR